MSTELEKALTHENEYLKRMLENYKEKMHETIIKLENKFKMLI